MKIRYIIPFILLSITACNQIEIDDEKPLIDLSIDGAFPGPCDTLYLGESFTWKVRFTDNVELGSYSLEIHHNLDHHAHSTEIEACVLDPVKTPKNPFLTIRDFDIPAGTKEYAVNQEISLPRSDGNGAFDEGDYHFYISLTDKEGWSTQKGLSIKIFNRE